MGISLFIVRLWSSVHPFARPFVHRWQIIMLLINQRTKFDPIIISNEFSILNGSLSVALSQSGAKWMCVTNRKPSIWVAFLQMNWELSISDTWFNFGLSLIDCVQCAMIWFNLIDFRRMCARVCFCIRLHCHAHCGKIGVEYQFHHPYGHLVLSIFNMECACLHYQTYFVSKK